MKKLFIILLAIICAYTGYAIDAKYLDNANPQLLPIAQMNKRDETGYFIVRQYQKIEPDFIDSLLSGETKEALEICAGQGYLLKNLLIEQSKRQGSNDIRITAVELSGANLEKLKKRFEKYDRRPGKNWLGFALKDVHEFIKANPDKKANKYDAVFAGFALHIFPPTKYVAIVNQLFYIIKEGGKLYITQHANHSGKYTEEYKNNVATSILPFWTFEDSQGKLQTQPIFCSDPVTMSALLSAFGFETVDSGIYGECLGNKIFNSYVGLIAVKKSSLRDEESVDRYLATAYDLQKQKACQ